jgi:hypothetical protein
VSTTVLLVDAEETQLFTVPWEKEVQSMAAAASIVAVSKWLAELHSSSHTGHAAADF